MATLGAAGLPMIQLDNAGSIVAAQALASRLGTGVEFRSAGGLGEALRRELSDRAVGSRVRDVREVFAFDTHADRLADVLRSVVDSRRPAIVPAIRALGGRPRRRERNLQDAPPAPPA
jgi:hypothetical protein